MNTIDESFPLEAIVNEIVNSEFACEILSKKSAEKTKRKLEHYVVLREEMTIRHNWEIDNIDAIISKYKKPLELREKVIQKRQAKLAELKGKLNDRGKAIAKMTELPPPASPPIESDSDDGEREGTEIGIGIKTYTMPR